MVELASALERALAYAFGGNAKVLSRALMSPLWLSRGIIDQGMPCLNIDKILGSGILANPHDPVIIRSENWPVTPSGRANYPAIASKRAQMLTYGDSHYMVSQFST